MGDSSVMMRGLLTPPELLGVVWAAYYDEDEQVQKKPIPTTTDDLYYANVPQRLQQQYDFITCTEVVEHLGQPREVFEQLVACLKPQGWLAIMTKRWLNRERFGTWFYLNDPTHISFFHLDTFHWLAEHFHLEIDYVAADVVMLRRPAK